MASKDPVDISKFRHTARAKTKWTGPPDHPSDLGESADAHFEYLLRPEEFFVPPADAQGRCVQITVRLQPQLLRVLSAMRDAPNSPYSTINDVVRHALHRHGRWFFAIEKDLKPSYLSVWKIALAATRDHNYLSETKANWRFVNERVKRLLENGDLPEARMELTKTKKLFEELPDGPPRRDVLRELYQKYGNFLAGGDPPSFK